MAIGGSPDHLPVTGLLSIEVNKRRASERLRSIVIENIGLFVV